MPLASHICELPSWDRAHQRRLFYFATGGLTFVEMAICKIDTSFPLQQRQLLQARLSASETTSHNMQQCRLGDCDTKTPTPRSALG